MWTLDMVVAGQQQLWHGGHGSMYLYATLGVIATVSARNVALNGNYVSKSASGNFKPSRTPINCTLYAYQTSLGKGILELMEGTVGTQVCIAADTPITVDIETQSSNTLRCLAENSRRIAGHRVA